MITVSEMATTAPAHDRIVSAKNRAAAMTLAQCRIPAATRGQLDYLAALSGLTRADLMRAALDAYLY